MKGLCVLLALAGTTCAALAAESRLIHEVSTDGGNTWAASADVLPGATIQIRMRCTVTGAPNAFGFASTKTYPILTNSNRFQGDVALPFTFPGLQMQPNLGVPGNESSYQGRPVLNTPANTGRMFPFGWATHAEFSANGLLGYHRGTTNPVSYFKFGGLDGPNLTAPMISDQGTANLMGTHFSSSRNVVLFKYAVQISQTLPLRTLIADVQLDGLARNYSRWYTTVDGTQQIDAPITVTTASINVVPSPQGITILALAAGLAARRRRT